MRIKTRILPIKSGRKHSLRVRQLSLFSLFLLVSVILSVVLYLNATQVAKQSIYDKMNAQADFYVDSIDQQLQNIKNIMYDVFSGRNLAFLVYPESTLTDYERRDAMLSEQERLISLTNGNMLVKSAVLFLPNANLKISNTFTEDMTEEDFRFLEKQVAPTDQIMNFEDGRLFMLSKGVPDQFGFEKNDAYFYVELDRNKLIETLSSFNTLSGSGSFLYQPSQNILIHSQNGADYGKRILQAVQASDNRYESHSESVRTDHNTFLTVVRESSIFGVFVQYSLEKEVLKPLEFYKWLVLAYIVVMGILALAFSAYTERNVHKPLLKLLGAFKNFREDDLRSGSELKLPEGSEFGYLYDGFNRMTGEIKNLVEEVYVQKNLTQKAELKQLQSQINPHFLYNSFFSLSRKIKREDLAGAERLASHLGVFFRFLTKNDSENVTLGSEIEHARSYADIQQSRFADRIHVDFQTLPDRLENVRVPRLILQPIIENAFEHGLENKESGGTLRISFSEKEHFLDIDVEDNGEDVDWNKLERLRAGMDMHASEEITALINIHKRLRIQFGSDAGLMIRPSRSGGVKVTIRIVCF